MHTNNLEELFVNQVRDLYSDESQIIIALPKMIAAASHQKLKDALIDHLEVTKAQRERLETIAEELDFEIGDQICKGMEGIITEANETLKNIDDPATKDAAIIISAQRVEHYEIAAYGGVLQFARDLEYDKAVDLLDQTLEEESDADELLSSLAEGGLFSEGINEAAIDAS